MNQKAPAAFKTAGAFFITPSVACGDSSLKEGALGSAENTGLTAQNGADRQAVMQSVPVEESTLDGMDSSNSQMRETYGMEAPRTENGQKAEPRFHFWIVDTLNALM